MASSPQVDRVRVRRAWRRPRKGPLLLFLVPLALLLALSVPLNSDLSTLDPTYGIWGLTQPWGNQSFTLPGLLDPVTIVRDGAGTAHIYAQDDQDLFYAQGYEQASDRLFQMEAESLEAQGNISEWVGGAGVASDIAFRSLGLPGAAYEMQAEMGSQVPWLANDVNAFCAGVNAYIAWAEAHDRLPIYFTGLGVEPYRWTPYATAAFMQLMIYGQTTGIYEPLYAALADTAVGDNATNEMFPIYPQYWQNFTVMPGDGTLDGSSLTSEGISPSYVFSQDWYASWATGIPPSEKATLGPLYQAALAAINDPYFPAPQVSQVSSGGGSNSWVVAANRSVDGLPMLANDPHLPVMLPSLWVPTQLVDPNYDVEGWSLAGLPGILIGHDPNVAWALTNSEGATALEYVETLQGNNYYQNGSWHPLTITNQSWTVAANATAPAHTETLELESTDNGPMLARLGNFGISVRWAADGPTWEAAAELEFDHAVTVSQFFHILQTWWDVPNLNALVAEDNATAGTTHIGWTIPARYPLVHVTMPDGQGLEVIGSRAPMNGSGGYEPVGTIPVSMMPTSIDPAQGYLYAPNQATVGQNFPYPMIGSWWDSGGRGHAIGTYLKDHPMMSISSMENLQSNVTDAWAVQFEPQLIQALEADAGSGGPTASLAQQALPLVQDWNGSFNATEVGPTIYTYWYDELDQDGYASILATKGVGGAPDAFPSALQYISKHDPSSSWFPGGWSSFSNESLADALTLLNTNLTAQGITSVSGWTWGVVHPFTMPSLTGEAQFAMGPYAHWGDTYTVSVAPSTTELSVPLKEVALASSLRMVAEPDPSLSSGGTAFGVIPGGASENPVSPYYANLLGLWLAHGYINFQLVPTSAGPFPDQEVSTWQLNP